ncbi:DUF3667 domain-containing protein [Flavobacterium sp. AED]|uniref:DUF3667 domain-containing protein n=1 Tax=Flavobacterium sp. AED TaxID=1423323 RepID=UPI00057FC189|nr:DUF3667 domain-containing protein [Flavobacterium sp. AED]KIA86565.1 hypothetical protein OA85_02605 [Flavobacterium sp. AED]
MGKTVLRKDKTCLNCRYVVENRFCPNCGQENTDIRKTFHHLFIHFFEDLTHYENAFWRTIKNLILKPASLTKEYLSGKRLSYLAPVRLYIFISFITFFLISVMPENKEANDSKPASEKFYNPTETVKKQDTIYKEQQKIIDFEKKGLISKKESDSIQKFIVASKEKKEDKEDGGFTFFGKQYKSVQEFDSIQKNAKPENKMGAFQYWLNRKTQLVNDRYTATELKEKFVESFIHNLPKALFVYMPLFAFILWLFQNKKKWYYFDHGIFTLHYFSFLLLGLLILKLENYFLGLLNEYPLFTVIDYIFTTIAVLYMLYYFFPAHHRFYGDSKIISITKGIVMFFINMFFVFIILTLFAVYTFINLH